MPTIAEQLTQLESDREDLVDNLETKGITGLTGDETFTELVPEVLNISGGGGSGLDWSAIGYSNIPEEYSKIKNGYDYAVQINNNWVVSESYNHLFEDDNNLVYMPLVNTSSGTEFGYMFSGCSNLTTVPQLNISSGTYLHSMFKGCSNLTAIPQLDASSATTLSNLFANSSNLETLGGFKDLGKGYLTTKNANYLSYILKLDVSTKITHDSLMNVINNLYDIATKGCNTQKLVLGSTNLAKLTAEEIAIATNKGWTVS